VTRTANKALRRLAAFQLLVAGPFAICGLVVLVRGNIGGDYFFCSWPAGLGSALITCLPLNDLIEEREYNEM
jgi:hypothetical protein